MNKFASLILIFSSIFVGSSAFAGFYVEPGLTYERGNNEIQWPAPLSDSTGDTSGLGVNVKLGTHIQDVFFVGLDGAYSKPKFENSATNYSADATSTLYGVVAGAQMPIVGLRIWAGYTFGGELDPKESGGLDVKFEEAKGPKVGVGFRVLAVSLNLEYSDLEYGKTVVQQFGPLSGNVDQNLKNKLTTLSVSIPLTL